MDHQWFWQHEGEMYGPLSTDELEDLVLRQRVLDDDLIRVDGTDEWLPASQIKGMFGVQAEPADDGTAASAASRALAKAAEIHARQKAELPDRTSIFTGLWRRGRLDVTGLVALGLELVELAFTQLGRLFGHKITLAVIAILLLAILLKNLQLGDTQAYDAHSQLAEAWDELQGMKQRQASAEEWTAFERETLEWLEPTLKSLGEAAVQNETGIHPTALWSNAHLNAARAQKGLVAAGGILKEVLADARQSKPEAPARRIMTDRNGRPIRQLPVTQVTRPVESRFADQMNVAQSFLEGSLKNSGQTPKKAAAVSATAGVDPVMAGFIVVDIGLVVGGAVFWWRRRRKASGVA